ncbi:MAG: CvpA family protein [Candidatus Eisenbacteria bacterium]
MPQSLNGIDILILVLLGLFFLHGMMRGLVRALFSLAALVAGWVVASRFHLDIASRWSVSGEAAELGLRVGVFALLFLGTALLVRLVGHGVNKVLSDSPLSLANRVLGGICGLLVGSVFLGVLFLVVATYFPSGHRVLGDAELYGPITGVVRVLARALPAEARGLLERHLDVEKAPLPGAADDYVSAPVRADFERSMDESGHLS